MVREGQRLGRSSTGTMNKWVNLDNRKLMFSVKFAVRRDSQVMFALGT